MSGSLRILFEEVKPPKHDHIDIVFKNNCLLRFTDPRKFGSFLWAKDPEVHPLLKDLGPEPLGNSFSGEYLFQVSRKRKVPLKSFIMNAKALLESNPNPTEKEVRFWLAGNLCRCTGYDKIVRAVLDAADNGEDDL